MSLDVETFPIPTSFVSTVCYLVDDDQPACASFNDNIQSTINGTVNTWVGLNFDSRRVPRYVSAIFTDFNGDLVASTKVTRLENLSAKEGVTMVLTLTNDDLERSSILFRTLGKFLKEDGIQELIVVVPDSQTDLIREKLPDSLGLSGGTSVRVVGERSLFHNYSEGWDKYALQMSIKLLVSRIIITDFYVTLDADVVAVGEVGVEDFVREGKGNWVKEVRGGGGGGRSEGSERSELPGAILYDKLRVATLPARRLYGLLDA